MSGARRLSQSSDADMRALTGSSGVLCGRCGSTGHNTAGHVAYPCRNDTDGDGDCPMCAHGQPDPPCRRGEYTHLEQLRDGQ